MKYAVIRSGGKQYKVSEGNILELDRLNTADKTIFFDDVLLFASDGNLHIGLPKVDGVTVTASVIGQTKGEKVRVSKYKAKVRFRRVTGFRASLTKVQITAISEKGKNKQAKPLETAKPKVAKKALKKTT